jgi:LacI family transcriptional regulator
VAFPEGDGDSCLEAVHEMLRRGSDGIIFDSSIFSEAFYRDYTDLVLSADTPISSLAGAGAHLLPNSIVPDNRRGGYIAAFHLLELGHRRIGFIGGPRESYTAGDLFIGIEEALEEAKDQGSAAIPVFDGGNNTAAGHDALESLLGQGVTGIIAGSGIIASGVLRRAFELGIRIPEQLSLVAYGNCSLSQDLHVPLTVVSIHYDRIARKAVKLIKKLGEKSPPLTPELLLPSLIIRESTGKAPAAAQQA